jgi:hypothetical protein
MARRRLKGDDGPDLFAAAGNPQSRLTLSGMAWPNPGTFPVNHSGTTVDKIVSTDLRQSRDALVVTGFASIAEIVDLVDARSGRGRLRVLLGWEPFASTRTSFGANAADTFNEAVRRYWIEDRGVDLRLSAKVVHALEAIDSGALDVRVVPGHDRLHAKIYLAGNAGTLGSSNFTRPGLHTQLEANARFERDVEPDRFEGLQRVGENYWEIGTPWNTEFAELLNNLLQFVGWREALARASADLLEGQWAEGYLATLEGAETLWPSQRYGIAEALWVVENVGSVLVADATGSGKTRMGAHLTAAVRNRLWSTGRVRRDLTVVVCPPKVEQDWLRESQACGLTARTVSQGRLSHGTPGETRLEARAVAEAQILAVDEAHNFLAQASKRTELVRNTTADHILMFTATPINRGAKDLLSLVDLLGADNFDDETLQVLDNLHRRRDFTLSERESELLRREIQRFTVRRTKTMLNDLVDADPSAYTDPTSGRPSRYPIHRTEEYPTGESAEDVDCARQIRAYSDELTGVGLLGTEIAMPAGLFDMTAEQYLNFRLRSAKALAAHHVLSALRSSKAALLEHLRGTEAAAEAVGIPRMTKLDSSGRQIDKLAELGERGRPKVKLDCDLPAWLSDDHAWRARCEQDHDLYLKIEQLARALDGSREAAKASRVAALARKHPLVLAFDHHPITLAVIEDHLRRQDVSVTVAVGGDAAGQKSVTKLFSRGSEHKGIALCSDAMNEGINLQGASCIVHLDMPTTLRVAEQRVGRVDRMNSPHDTIEVWWPKDGPAFATRADELLAVRNAESTALLGSNLQIPGGAVIDHSAYARTDDWDGLHDALEPVRRLVTGDEALIDRKTYESQKDARERVIARVSPVRSSRPWAFFAIAGTTRGAPRWLLLDNAADRPITDLRDVTEHLRTLLAEDPPQRQFDDASAAHLDAFLKAAAAAERSLLPRRDQRAVTQLLMCARAWATAAKRQGDYDDHSRRWDAIADLVEASEDDQVVDLHEVAAVWHRLVRPMRDAYRAENRRKRYVTLSDLDSRLKSNPLALEKVEEALSGLELIPPLSRRISACILGVPD